MILELYFVSYKGATLRVGTRVSIIKLIGHFSSVGVHVSADTVVCHMESKNSHYHTAHVKIR